jgi:two-component system, OmpR family, response regulator ChvI
LEELYFKSHSENYCVSFIDIVGSTSLVSTLNLSENVRKFYSIFINAIARVLNKHNGKIIKTVGDGVLSYFPLTVSSVNRRAFEEVIDCCFAQIDACGDINSDLERGGLPRISYRISADYGKVEIANSKVSTIEDFFGPTINYCSKINSYASPNGVVIGNDLFRILKSFSHFEGNCFFEEVPSYHLGVGKYSYPLYSLSRSVNHPKINAANTKSIEKQRFEVYNKSLSKPNILLIDDERDDLFVFEKYLTLGGFGVKSFSSSRQALEHFVSVNPSHYDLIVSDIRMPDINGFELYLKLKSISSDVKIIFATCLEVADEILSLIPTVNQHQIIKKPIEQNVFLEHVRKNLGSRGQCT